MLKSDLRETVVIKLKVNLAFKYETYFKKLVGKEDNSYIIALFLHRVLIILKYVKFQKSVGVYQVYWYKM